MSHVRRPRVDLLLRRRPRHPRQDPPPPRVHPPVAPRRTHGDHVLQRDPLADRQAVQGEAGHPVGEAARQLPPQAAAWLRRRPHPPVAFERQALRGRDGHSPAHDGAGGERRAAREVRVVPERPSVSRLPRRAPESRVVRRHGGGPHDRGGDGASREGRPDVLQGTDRPRLRRGEGRPEGDREAARVPQRRGPRLPHARPVERFSLRRRDAAHPPRLADRERAHGRAVRARRTHHRPASARQRAPDRHAEGAARPRQHRGGGGARRGDDAHRGLHRGPRPGRGPRRRPRDVPGRFQGSPQIPHAHGRLPHRSQKNRIAIRHVCGAPHAARTTNHEPRTTKIPHHLRLYAP